LEDIMNPEEIQKILEEHRLWLDSDGKDGKRADFEGANLEGADLEGAYLQGAILKGAHLEKAHLGGAKLQGADLEGAYLQGAILKEAYLGGTHFEKANLEGANLERADLELAHLGGAYLRGANLEGANLDGANLVGTDLKEACLEGAHLVGAYLQGASLIKANLMNAALGYADLQEANLRGADLCGASLLGADLKEADLKDAHLLKATLMLTKLDMVNFERTDLASIFIDKKTMLTLPKSAIDRYGSTFFVRGWLDSADKKNTLISSTEFPTCFISYSTMDTEFAVKLYTDLQHEGICCWFAPEDIKGGKKLFPQLDEAIRIHDKFILILSESSINSEWVATEIKRTRIYEKQENKQRLFPISLIEYEDLKEWELFDSDTVTDLASEVRSYYIPDFSNWEDDHSYKKAFDRLLKDLKAGD
jgi:uncharacterized protein YjbI with pentapeptide repeats